MATFSVTNTFVNNTTADGPQVTTNFSDITGVLTLIDAGTTTWNNVKISATAANPLDVTGSAATTELSINNSATDGDPILTFKLGSTTQFSLGVDDSDSDALLLGTTSITTAQTLRIPSGGGQIQVQGGDGTTPGIGIIGDSNTGICDAASVDTLAVTTGGTIRMTWENTVVTSKVKHLFANATVSLPNGFDSDTDCGFYRPTTNQFAISVNGAVSAIFDPAVIRFSIAGTGKVEVDTTAIYPVTDNSISCGLVGARWTVVYAVNGTIQTSHSSTKTDIVDLDAASLPTVRGIKFKRPDDANDIIGFEADNLPEECFAINEDGTRSDVNVYTSSVIGVLAAKMDAIDKRIALLEAR